MPHLLRQIAYGFPCCDHHFPHIGFLLSGPLLEWTGFDAALEGAQPEAVLRNMRIGYIAIPVIALLLALILLKVFPITPERAAEIREQLEARRGKV